MTQLAVLAAVTVWPKGKGVLATEDIFSNGFVSDLIRWICAPIPIRKQTADTAAIHR